MSLPIVFIHTGYSSYLEFTLRQAKHTNPDSDLILLGDESNNRFDFITHVNMKDCFGQANEFAKVYQHYSTNTYEYELFCFQRWFVLEEYLLSKGYEEVFVCDSDIMLYSNISDVVNSNYSDIDIGVVYNATKNHVCIGLSYWKVKYLKYLNECMLEIYKNKDCLNQMKSLWSEEVARHGVGSISDMRAAKKFYLEYMARIKIISFEEIKDNSIFENNINESSSFEPNEYEMRLGKKKLSWKNKRPYGNNLIKGKLIRFNSLHFQGPAKFLTSKYYTGKHFKGKFMLDGKFKVLSFLAFWYKILKIRYRFAFIFNLILKKSK